MLKASKNKSTGFTLIELLISLSITMTIATIMVANFRQASRRFDLKQAASELESNLRRVKTMSLAGTQFQGSTPIGGYGIVFDVSQPTSYRLFADVNGNWLDDPGEDLAGGVVSLPPQVTLRTVVPQDVTSVVFTPPQPKIYINQKDTGTTVVSVTLQHEVSHDFTFVTLNTISGQTNIQSTLSP